MERNAERAAPPALREDIGMIPRNSQPSRAADSHAGKGACSDVACKCCAALERAREGALFDALREYQSPLTPDIQEANLGASADGTMLKAKMGRDWKRMFEQLPGIGMGLMMTRNEAAILGRHKAFPALAFTAGGSKGADAESGLWWDFRGLGAAHAVHLRAGNRNIFGVEFTDARGEIIHRFTATQESNLEVFFNWARLHQACPAGDAAERVASRHALSFGKTGMVSACDAACRESGVGAIDVDADKDALISLAAACCKHGIEMEAAVSNDAVTQRVRFTPKSLLQVEEWWFVSNDTAGLHFLPEEFIRVEIVESIGGAGTQWSLHCHTADRESALVLACGNLEQYPAWCEILHAFA